MGLQACKACTHHCAMKSRNHNEAQQAAAGGGVGGNRCVSHRFVIQALQFFLNAAVVSTEDHLHVGPSVPFSDSTLLETQGSHFLHKTKQKFSLLQGY